MFSYNNLPSNLRKTFENLDEMHAHPIARQAHADLSNYVTHDLSAHDERIKRLEDIVQQHTLQNARQDALLKPLAYDKVIAMTYEACQVIHFEIMGVTESKAKRMPGSKKRECFDDSRDKIRKAIVNAGDALTPRLQHLIEDDGVRAILLDTTIQQQRNASVHYGYATAAISLQDTLKNTPATSREHHLAMASAKLIEQATRRTIEDLVKSAHTLPKAASSEPEPE